MKKKKKVSLAAKIGVLIFAVYAGVTLVSLQMDIGAKRQEQEELAVVLDAQITKNAELESVVSNGVDEAFIAKIARESLGYVTHGEIVFVDISGE